MGFSPPKPEILATSLFAGFTIRHQLLAAVDNNVVAGSGGVVPRCVACDRTPLTTTIAINARASYSLTTVSQVQPTFYTLRGIVK